MISETIQASPMKLCTVIVLLKTYENTQRKFQKSDICTSLLKQWENWDLLETKQIIYFLKGNNEIFPKM